MLLSLLNALFGELPSPSPGVPVEKGGVSAPVEQQQQDGAPLQTDTGADEILTIDQNAKYTFGQENISGSELLQFASLGKLDRSESVQSERDNYRNQVETQTTELATLKAQNEIFQKQIEQLDQTEPEPSDLSQVFEQLTSVPTTSLPQDEYEANGGQQVVDRGFATIEQLKLVTQALSSDFAKMLDDKFNVIPSRDELQTATQAATQEAVTQVQQVNDARQQLEASRTAVMQPIIQQLVDERGWTQAEANEYSLQREQIGQVMAEGLTDTSKYALSQELDLKNRAFEKQLDEAATARSTQEEADAAMTQTASPRQFTYEPPAEGEKPQYVSSEQRYEDATAAAHEILKKGKVLG